MLGRLNRLLRPAPPPRPLPVSMAAAISLDEWIEMTTWCRDCDILPKVEHAGAIITESDGTRVQVMHNGLRVVADKYCGPWTTDLIRRCHGHHEPQEERVFHEVLARLPLDATMIELGSWWSYYTLWFLLDQPRRRAIALEPDPEHRALGKANAERNHLAPVFVDGFAGAVSVSSAPFRRETGEIIAIACHSVPDLMERHGIAVLDLLHCDAQGAETDVLTSCIPLLREGRILTIVVSTHHHTISGDPLTHQRCLAIVEANGGMVIAEHDVHESFSGDGLIVARFGPDQAAWPVIPVSRNRYSTSLFRNPLYDLADVRRG